MEEGLWMILYYSNPLNIPLVGRSFIKHYKFKAYKVPGWIASSRQLLHLETLSRANFIMSGQVIFIQAAQPVKTCPSTFIVALKCG